MSFLVVAICNRDRGVPFAGLLIVAMIVFWTFVAKRTTSAATSTPSAATRRPRAAPGSRGVRADLRLHDLRRDGRARRRRSPRGSARGVDWRRRRCCSDAIAAAVIGGTSLFGGRGRVVSALLGALVIMTISNGLGLLGSSSATEYIITGIILLAAVTLDTLSRRRLEKSGR